MAETYGFFQATWDNSLTNPETGEQTGWWDRVYTAKQFVDYFSLLVGNGVFASPVNQLMVIPGIGNNIVISPGWAFIKGNWYNNDSEKVLAIGVNASSTSRVDSVRVRLSNSDKRINAIVVEGSTNLTRGDNVYDIELARVTVSPGSTQISSSGINDMRPNASVCGFVTGLLNVVDAGDLFQQFTGMFNEWFDTVKGQVAGDLAIKLQTEFVQINEDVNEFYDNVTDDIAAYKNAMQQQYNSFTSTTNQSIETISQTATDAYTTMNNFVDNDFVIQEQSLSFNGLIADVVNSNVKSTSLIDAYFTADTISEAESARIIVDSLEGRIRFTAESTPKKTLKVKIRVRVNG